MGDDGGFSGGFDNSGGGFDSSGGGFGSSAGDEDNSFRGALNGASSGGDDDRFRGALNGATDDSRYSAEDSNLRNSTENIHTSWRESDSKEDGLSSREILTVLGPPEEKIFQNGDAVMSPMLNDEGSTGQGLGRDAFPERNPCEDCFFGTLVCCDCTIL